MALSSTERWILYGAGAIVVYGLVTRRGFASGLSGLPSGVWPETTEQILGITGPIPAPTGQGDPFLRGETPCGFPGSPPCHELALPYSSPAQIDPTIGDPYALEVPPSYRQWLLPTQSVAWPVIPEEGRITLTPCIDPLTGSVQPC